MAANNKVAPSESDAAMVTFPACSPASSVPCTFRCLVHVQRLTHTTTIQNFQHLHMYACIQASEEESHKTAESVDKTDMAANKAVHSGPDDANVSSPPWSVLHNKKNIPIF